MLLFLLPRGWTSWLGALSQIALPLQDASSAATHAVTGALNPHPSSEVSPQEHEAALKREQFLQNQVAALSSRVAALERENQILLATRIDGRIGAQGRLIPARVVAHDIAPWRATRTIAAGSTRGVRPGNAVVSREFADIRARSVSEGFAIEAGADDGVTPGLAVLLGEVYLGFIERTNAFSSRVLLVSDPNTQLKVRVGRFSEDGFVEAKQSFWLVGAGDERMEIKDVARRDVDAGTIAVGDTVLASPEQTSLPAALTIGTVEAIDPDRDNPLLSVLTVRSAVSLRSVRTVYVYDPHPDEG